MSLDEIGLDFDCTRERIRQIEKQAISKLRRGRRRVLLYPFYSEHDMWSPDYVHELPALKGDFAGRYRKIINRWGELYLNKR